MLQWCNTPLKAWNCYPGACRPVMVQRTHDAWHGSLLSPSVMLSNPQLDSNLCLRKFQAADTSKHVLRPVLQLLSLHRYHHRAYCDIIHLPLTLPPDLMTQRSSQPQKLENSLTSHACFPFLYQQVNFDKLRTPLATSMNISLCNAPATCSWSNNRTTNWLFFTEGKFPG